MEQAVKTNDVFADIGAVYQLLVLLEQNQKKEQLSTVQGLVDTISSIENNLNTAMAELKNVKAQLNMDTKSDPKTTIKEITLQQVQKLENGLQRLKNQLNIIKEKFVGTAQNIIDTAKDKGFKALDKISDFMNLKENLTALTEGISKNISKVTKNIDTINSMTQELNAATKHIKNVGRAITGKERDGNMAKSSERIVKPLQEVKKLLVNMEFKSMSAVATVGYIAKRAGREETQEKKPSIIKKLEDEKVNVKKPTATKDKTKDMTL